MLLLDSNILIYATKPGYEEIRNLIETNIINISVVSKIEVLGYHKLSLANKFQLENLFDLFEILSISNHIVEEAILLRQHKKMSLGDSLIAATALTHNLTLVTANVKDFEWIPTLHFINPVK